MNENVIDSVDGTLHVVDYAVLLNDVSDEAMEAAGNTMMARATVNNNNTSCFSPCRN